MPRSSFKRFYEHARAGDGETGYAVLLDGKPIRPPGGEGLVMASRNLAEAVAEEWERQGEKVDPRTMPLTALVCTAIDRVRLERDRVCAEVAAYGAHDLLCYHAASPADLAERQARAWQPLLDWAAKRYGARLAVTTGAVSVKQPPEALAALRCAVDDRDDMGLTALASAVGAAGSLVIGLALAEGRLEAEEAWEAALVDELYQANRWGEDREAAGRRAAIRAELEAARRMFVLTGLGE